MKILLVILVIGAILFGLGFVYFDFSGGRATMTIETDRIQEESEEALDKGAQALDRAGEKIEKGIHDLRNENAVTEDEQLRDGTVAPEREAPLTP